MAILFLSYDQMKSMLPPWSQSLPIHSVLGGFSGALAGWLTTPLDVVKTNILLADKIRYLNPSLLRFAAPDAALKSSPGKVCGKIKMQTFSSLAPSTETSISMPAVAKRIVSKHGACGLMTGAVARSFWWFGICSIFFPSYEMLKECFVFINY
jgi:hypothetical protein